MTFHRHLSFKAAGDNVAHDFSDGLFKLFLTEERVGGGEGGGDGRFPEKNPCTAKTAGKKSESHDMGNKNQWVLSTLQTLQIVAWLILVPF